MMILKVENPRVGSSTLPSTTQILKAHLGEIFTPLDYGNRGSSPIIVIAIS